jgi:hypothetical protein
VRDKGWRAAAKAQLAAQHGLNRSQRKAVADAMIASVTLWQGPPGTGKTATLLALIQVLVCVCVLCVCSCVCVCACACLCMCLCVCVCVCVCV